LRACSSLGCDLITRSVDPNGKDRARLLASILERDRPAGLIVSPPFSDDVGLLTAGQEAIDHFRDERPSLLRLFGRAMLDLRFDRERTRLAAANRPHFPDERDVLGRGDGRYEERPRIGPARQPAGERCVRRGRRRSDRGRAERTERERGDREAS